MALKGYEEVWGGVQRSANGNVVTIKGETYVKTATPWKIHQDDWTEDVDQRRRAFLKRHEGHDHGRWLLPSKTGVGASAGSISIETKPDPRTYLVN